MSKTPLYSLFGQVVVNILNIVLNIFSEKSIILFVYFLNCHFYQYLVSIYFFKREIYSCLLSF